MELRSNANGGYKASWKLGKLYSPKTRVGMISGLSKFTRNKAWDSQVKRAKFDVEYEAL